MGRPHRREDHPGHRDGAARGAADLLADRLGRRADHRPGRAVPGPPRRGPDLPQPGRAVRQGAADLLPVRPVGGRRRVHPGVLRRRDHGRGQRVDVPRLARGWPRWSSARRSSLEEMGGARMHGTVSGCGDLLAVDDADAIEQAKLFFSYLPTCWREQPPTYAAEAPVAPLDADAVPEPRADAVRHARRDRRAGRRRLVLRGQAAVRRRARHRLRPDRRRARRHRREQLRGQGRRAVRRLRRQGRAVHLAVRRVQRPAALPRRRARAS